MIESFNAVLAFSTPLYEAAKLKVRAFLERKDPKEIVLFAVLSALIVYFTFKNLEAWNRLQIDDTLPVVPHAVECNENGTLNEWISLDKRYFFKKTAAFYIVETNRIRVLLVLRMAVPRLNGRIRGQFEPLPVDLKTFRMQVVVKKKGQTSELVSTWIYDTTMTTPFGPESPVYYQANLDADFDLARLLKGRAASVDDVYLELFVYNRETGSRTERPLMLKTKHLRNATLAAHKNSSMRSLFCAKCLFLKARDADEFKWWMELNRRAGYERLVFCNQTIENTPALNELFVEYASFIEIRYLKCLPNLLENDYYAPEEPMKYFISFDDLKLNGSYHSFTADAFNVIFTNECYLDHFDQYDYIGLHDLDELIMPQVSEHVNTLSRNRNIMTNMRLVDAVWRDTFGHFLREDKCDRFRATGDNNSLSAFLKHLVAENDIRTPTSLFFNQGHLFTFRSIDLIFARLDAYLSASVNEWNMGAFHSINITDNSTRHEWKPEPYSFRLFIENYEDMLYAMNLLSFYKRFRPALLHINTFFADNSFNRFFILLHSKNEWGKTVHNTLSSFEHLVHKPRRSFATFRNSTTTSGRVQITDKALIYRNDEEQGYMLHFRHALKHSPEIIWIRNIYFDFNYFNCHFVPIFRDFYNQADFVWRFL